MTVDTAWRTRTRGSDVRARRLDTVPEIHIAYGERTWTTEQSVRDIMQNPLDAQSELFMKQLEDAAFDPADAQKYLHEFGEVGTKKALDFLLALFRYKKYYSSQDSATKKVSHEHLVSLAAGLPLKKKYRDTAGSFLLPAFLQDTAELVEKNPDVYFGVVDTEAKEGKQDLGFVHYDTFNTEPLYQDRRRFRIFSVKITDNGSGYDSQLTSTFLSTKKGKEYVRGMFGEGAKMSILHLLRHGARVYKRSRFNFTDAEGAQKGRSWVMKYETQGTKLSTKGVERERAESHTETGSSTTIVLTGAERVFSETLLANIDPRSKGLASNVAEFSDAVFMFPTPLSTKYHTGVNIGGNPSEQFVHGLRVPTDKDQSYYKPMFSYNFLDNALIKGRDRNEIDDVLDERIKYLWAYTQDVRLWEKVVTAAVVGENNDRHVGNGPELLALGAFLRSDGETFRIDYRSTYEIGASDILSLQKKLDMMLVDALKLKSLAEPSVIITQSEEDDVENNFWRLRREAEERGYKFIVLGTDVDGIDEFIERHADQFPIHSYGSIRKELDQKEREERSIKKIDPPEMIAHKERLRSQFHVVLAACNAVALKAGLEACTVTDVAVEDRDAWENDEYKAPVRVYFSRARINPNLFKVDATDSEIQRTMRRYIWGAWSNAIKESGADDTERHRRDDERRGALLDSQRVLDTMLDTLAPQQSAVYAALPENIDYAADEALLERFLIAAKEGLGLTREEDALLYDLYMEAMSAETTHAHVLDIERRVTEEVSKEKSREFLELVRRRYFFDGTTLTRYNENDKKWEVITVTKKVGEWNGHPVYKLPANEDSWRRSDEYFIPAPFNNNSVLRKGDVKEREYWYLDAGRMFQIGRSSYNTGYSDYRARMGSVVVPHPDGLYVRPDRGETWQNMLEEYTYDDGGKKMFSDTVSFGTKRTEFALDSVQGEWLKPVRIFQDLIQNHADAIENKEDITEQFFVIRNGVRLEKPIAAKELRDEKEDVIVGYKILDKGDGYLSGDIATMGASGKAHPLRAGKYGEGRIMTTASILTSGLGLTFESMGMHEGKQVAWSAEATVVTKDVVRNGAQGSVAYAAYNVQERAVSDTYTSATYVYLPVDIPEVERGAVESRWVEWVQTIDPRKKNAQKHGGIARYARVLRKPGSERVSKVGSFELLLDEPNTIYENGLRICPESEEGRNLPLGIDCPEIVTTRERNSYNKERLQQFYTHALGHTTNRGAIQGVLRYLAGGGKFGVLSFNEIFSDKFTSAPIWADEARKLWPNKFVISTEDLKRDMRGPDWGEDESADAEDRRREAAKILAQLPHFKAGSVLDVPMNSIHGFEKMLPSYRKTVENMLEDSTIPLDPKIEIILANAVSKGVVRVMAAVNRARERGFEYESLPDEIALWSAAERIVEEKKMALAKLDSGYHGRAGDAMTLNEMLLLPDRRANLAHTVEHELIHLLTGEYDYTDAFVAVLEELVLEE